MEGDRVEGEGVVVDRGATIRKVVCLAGWAALVSFAVFFAPGTDENTKEIILELIKNPISDKVNGLFAFIFNGFPIWSMLYAATLLPGDKDQKPSPLPFLGASLAIGAFALLPYLAIRKYRPEAIDPNFLKTKKAILEPRWVAVTMIAGALVLGANAFALFDERRAIVDYIFYAQWVDFTLLFKAEKFVSVSTIDTTCLWLFFVDPLVEDMRRRRMYQGKLEDIVLVSTIMAVPLIGPCFYLLLRPRADTFPPRPSTSASPPPPSE